MTNKNNEAPGNKASEIKKTVVELNENDLSKVAGGAARADGVQDPDDDISLRDDNTRQNQNDDITIADPNKDAAGDVTIADDGTR